ncbi:hypothetical protein L3Q82_004278 [Scortum barcoo]|uniref:Uncharacterized protein n=1 Tax=Scortum barcoo TaxID=214431 RepID=A0ACB8VJ40_9TELE|nr:hypothetical protein L3Q82_004278 [Scortum barcoo]
MPPGRLLPRGGVPGVSHREEASGKTQDTLERLCLSAGLGTPSGIPPEELEEVSGVLESCTAILAVGIRSRESKIAFSRETLGMLSVFLCWISVIFGISKPARSQRVFLLGGGGVAVSQREYDSPEFV